MEKWDFSLIGILKNVLFVKLTSLGYIIPAWTAEDIHVSIAEIMLFQEVRLQ